MMAIPPNAQNESPDLNEGAGTLYEFRLPLFEWRQMKNINPIFVKSAFRLQPGSLVMNRFRVQS